MKTGNGTIKSNSIHSHLYEITLFSSTSVIHILLSVLIKYGVASVLIIFFISFKTISGSVLVTLKFSKYLLMLVIFHDHKFLYSSK